MRTCDMHVGVSSDSCGKPVVRRCPNEASRAINNYKGFRWIVYVCEECFQKIEERKHDE